MGCNLIISVARHDRVATCEKSINDDFAPSSTSKNLSRTATCGCCIQVDHDAFLQLTRLPIKAITWWFFYKFGI